MRLSPSISWLLMAFLLALLPAYYALHYTLGGPAFEDAAMLMRYAEHLAQGHGIVYNPGGQPVDGATDFLFMVMAAALNACGVPIEAAVRTLIVLAHMATLFLIFHTLLVRQGAPGWAALLAVAWAATGPALLHAQAGFGAPVFALAALVTWRLAQQVQQQSGGWRTAIAFGFAALTTGLIRPEGVFLTAFMAAALFLSLGWRASRQALLAYVGIMGVLGGGYFLWRWQYFGHPLPNPFYIKGHGMIYLGSLRHSVRHAILLGWPFVLLGLPAIVGIQHRQSRRVLVFHLFPLLAFTGLWLLLSNAMNYAMRFQYVLMPLVLVSWFPLSQVAPQPLRLVRPGFALGAALACLLVLGGMALQHRQFAMKGQKFPDGRVDLATALQPYAQKGYLMAITEAGNLPLYSHWQSLDTWGLNDSRIAHECGITTARLRQEAPTLLMWHSHYAEQPPHNPIDPPWERMVDTLRAFAQQEDYTLAAAFGHSAHNLHVYYVRRDCPDADALASLIRNFRYVWYEDGDTLSAMPL